MKLSDAIALGSLVVKPAARTFWNGESGCALGMALIAIGAEPDILSYVSVAKRWPWTCEVRYYLGPCGHKRITAGLAVTHCFDEHVCGDRTMSLETLISWVRSIEPSEVEPEIHEEEIFSEKVKIS